ncbi:hypothetical protein BVG81_001630 [Haliangium sp. UPWRP_2]|nr:hypothetical protein BVG81_001630 [Haliangium sp. UPWRP_2]
MALVLLSAALSVAIPVCGAYVVEKVVVPRLAERYGIDLRLAEARIRPTRVMLRGLIVRIPGRADPLTCPRAEVQFRPLSLLSGQLELTTVTIDRPLIQLIRGGDEDNVTELLSRVRTPSSAPSEPGRRRRITGPQTLVLQSAELDIRDELGTLHVGGVDATVARSGASQLTLHDSNAEVAGGASARAGRVIVRWNSEGRFMPLGLPEVEVFGAAIVPWRRLAMTGINGTIRPDAAEPTRAVIALAGGYGGVDRELWQARGWVRPDGNGNLRSQRGAEAELSILAQRFRLSSIEPILKDTPIIDAEQTEVDASLDLKFAQRALDFSGSFHMAGLSIYTPRLLAEPVRDLGFDVTARGRIDLKTRRFRLEKAAVTWNGATAEIDGEAEAQPAGLGPSLAAAAPPQPTAQPTVLAAPGGPPAAAPTRGWRERWRSVTLHLAVPPIACQALLDSLPDGIVSRIRDFKLGGTFSTDVRLFVDFAKLMKLPPARDPNALEDEEGAEALPPPPPPPPPPPKAKVVRGPNGALVAAPKEPKDEPVQLSGKVGIDGCKVLEAPKEMLATRLLVPFEHSVLIEGDRELRFVIGDENPNYVSYDQISPHLINSIMTTEDNGFLRHRGFILPEFRSALQSNLERGYFRLGASSITMQMVKNVLLSKEKTLSRKLQELFLTWYLETYLTDDVEMLKAVGKGMSPNQYWLTKLQKNAAAAKEAAAAAAAAAAGQLTAPEPAVPTAPAAPVTAAQAYSPLRDINPIKRRILEIYFNAIEFGPYLYGIGKAARHYFGKSAKDLTPREAAWFSSILPNPKRRYIHFCKGAADEKWEKYIDRIVRRNHERGRLTDEEFAIAMQDRLVFDRAEALPEKECFALITRLTDQAQQAALAAAAAAGSGGPLPTPLPLPPPQPVKLPPPPPWAQDEVHTRTKKTP